MWRLSHTLQSTKQFHQQMDQQKRDSEWPHYADHPRLESDHPRQAETSLRHQIKALALDDNALGTVM